MSSFSYEDLQTCVLFDITLKELEEDRKKRDAEQQQEILQDKSNME